MPETRRQHRNILFTGTLLLWFWSRNWSFSGSGSGACHGYLESLETWPSLVQWMWTDWAADAGTTLQGSLAVCPDRISSRDEPDRWMLNLKQMSPWRISYSRQGNTRRPEGDPGSPRRTISGEVGGLRGPFCGTHEHIRRLSPRHQL